MHYVRLHNPLYLVFLAICTFVLKADCFYSRECGHCYISTDGNTEYSDYIYPSRESAKTACLQKHDKCGSHLNPGYQECLRREYTSTCHSAMSASIKSSGHTSTPCHFTDTDMDACIQMAGIQGLTRRDCYVYEQQNGKYRYQAPGLTQQVVGTCSTWSCQNCDYNRAACINRCFCNAYSPFHCPSPHFTIPRNERYWNRINEGSSETRGCERDCLEEWLGCRISCSDAPSLSKRVQYGQCISKCVCNIHLVLWCPKYGYPVAGHLSSTARSVEPPLTQTLRAKGEDELQNTTERQDGYNYDLSCERECAKILR